MSSGKLPCSSQCCFDVVLTGRGCGGQVQHLYGAMGGEAAQMGTPHAHMQPWSPAGDSPHQQQAAVSNGWRLGSGGALPKLAEHPEQVLQPASSGSGYSDCPPTQVRRPLSAAPSLLQAPYARHLVLILFCHPLHTIRRSAHSLESILSHVPAYVSLR